MMIVKSPIDVIIEYQYSSFYGLLENVQQCPNEGYIIKAIIPASEEKATKIIRNLYRKLFRNISSNELLNDYSKAKYENDISLEMLLELSDDSEESLSHLINFVNDNIGVIYTSIPWNI